MRRFFAAFAAALLGAVAVVSLHPDVVGAAAEPPLDVPATALAGALTCSGDAHAAGLTPVLLVPGTALEPKANFNWNYEKAFTTSGRPWCAVTVPGRGMGDIQVAAEYIVYGIRALHAAAGRPISVLGYSQGGMSPRWALKWWPDTRAMVDDLVGIDPSNHGTLDTVPLCLLVCAPSLWQQDFRSHFLAALNAGQETYAGISYTQIYSELDEVVVPNLGPAASSALTTGPGEIRNVAVQSICPLHIAEHVTMGTVDPVAYALVLDALDHPGPAQPARISRAVCHTLFLPGVTAPAVVRGELRFAAEAGTSLTLYPQVRREPALAGYATS